MDKTVKQDWVTALRSRKYTQGFERLKAINQDGDVCHCALGVLVELFHQQTKQGEWRPSDFGTIKFHHVEQADATEPLPVVLRWAGLTSSDPIVLEHMQQTVMSMNDVKQMAFPEIAKAIENSTLL